MAPPAWPAHPNHLRRPIRAPGRAAPASGVIAAAGRDRKIVRLRRKGQGVVPWWRSVVAGMPGEARGRGFALGQAARLVMVLGKPKRQFTVFGQSVR